LQESHKWPGLAAIGKVVRTRETTAKTTTETPYYLLSAALSAEKFNEVVRSHWGGREPAALASGCYSTGCACGTLASLARCRDGQFVPAGICWARLPKVPRARARGMADGGVERSFAWLSCYRRLNTIFERSKEHLIAFVAIAFISILSRRLRRLVIEEISA
jgi:hypothetical protein